MPEQPRARTSIGYWIVMDAPVATERIARSGFDYVCIDAQHGLIDHAAVVHAMMAIDAGGAIAVREGRPAPAGLVRVRENAPGVISQALDAGAEGVIVPLVESAEQAAAAAAAVRYPPQGTRSYGPMRAMLRRGTDLEQINAQLRCFVMIETAEGLAHLDEIARTPGVDGLYIGPSDLAISLGGRTSTDPAVADELERAVARILAAARDAGILAGIHTANGAQARARRAQGFDMITIASDLTHLEAAAAAHLAEARSA